MKANIGDRIGAIGKMDKVEVWLFGYGVYDEGIPPADSKGERGLIDFVHHANVTNPKLVMDDGTIIWGCECWWGPEDEVKKMIGDRKVTHIKPKYELE